MRQLFVAPLAFFVPAAVRELPAFRRVRTESFRPRVRGLTLQGIAGGEEIDCHGDLHHSILDGRLTRSLRSRCDCDHKKAFFTAGSALRGRWEKIKFSREVRGVAGQKTRPKNSAL